MDNINYNTLNIEKINEALNEQGFEVLNDDRSDCGLQLSVEEDGGGWLLSINIKDLKAILGKSGTAEKIWNDAVGTEMPDLIFKNKEK